MNGFLNYAACNVHARRGAAYGMASSAVAALVLLVPVILLAAATIGQAYIGRPGLSGNDFPARLVLLIIPTLAMIALPATGLVLAAAGFAISKRECQFAIAGLIINLAALTAALWSILG